MEDDFLESITKLISARNSHINKIAKELKIASGLSFENLLSTPHSCSMSLCILRRRRRCCRLECLLPCKVSRLLVHDKGIIKEKSPLNVPLIACF